MKTLLGVLPEDVRNRFLIWLFAFTKIRMLHYIAPRFVEMTNERSVVLIRLNRRTRNHLNSMYFGVMAAGADMAGGLMAMRLIQDSGRKVALIFKDFRAEFFKRAEGDTLFTCNDGAAVRALVKQAIDTGERVNATVHVTATVPSVLGDDPVAQFELTLSLKLRD
jgi:acyl-coenzyme A thioesterase PaaI-like protein